MSGIFREDRGKSAKLAIKLATKRCRKSAKVRTIRGRGEWQCLKQTGRRPYMTVAWGNALSFIHIGYNPPGIDLYGDVTTASAGLEVWLLSPTG